MLPRVLDNLQQLEQQRINSLKHSVLKCVRKEKEVQPIIGKCLDTIEKAVGEVNAVEDTEIAIERYKSGDVPPADFKFDDIQVRTCFVVGTLPESLYSFGKNCFFWQLIAFRWSIFIVFSWFSKLELW